RGCPGRRRPQFRRDRGRATGGGGGAKSGLKMVGKQPPVESRAESGWRLLSLGNRAFMDCKPELRTGRQSVDEGLRQEIAKLRQSKVKELRVRYRELFGEESPSSNRMHLFRRVAWRLQARDAGELSEQARQRAAQLANDADLRVRAPRDFWRLLESA